MRTEKQDIINASMKFKEYGVENLEEIVAFLADQAKYKGELSTKELAEKITNITEDSYNEHDFKYKDYLGRYVSTPFDLIFITMMYWVKLNHLNLAKLNKDIKAVNDSFLNKVEQKANSSENVEKRKDAIDKVFSNIIRSPLTLICEYNPDRNRIDALFSDAVIADLERKKFKFNLITNQVMEGLAERLMFIAPMMALVDQEASEENIEVINLDYFLNKVKEPLSRNILRLIDGYPCVTEDEIVEIILGGFDNKKIMKYLKANTMVHGDSLKAWDKYQYAEDSQAIKMRGLLLNRKSTSYKNLDEVGNVTKEDILKSVDKMINDGIVLHLNPTDEFEAPYIIERHVSKDYLVLDTDLINQAIFEMKYRVEKLCNENFFNQFLR